MFWSFIGRSRFSATKLTVAVRRSRKDSEGRGESVLACKGVRVQDDGG